jgi:hypothetical protein
MGKTVSDVTIVDTDILIDAGRGVSDAVTCLEEIQCRSGVTSVQ